MSNRSVTIGLGCFAALELGASIFRNSVSLSDVITFVVPPVVLAVLCSAYALRRLKTAFAQAVTIGATVVLLALHYVWSTINTAHDLGWGLVYLSASLILVVIFFSLAVATKLTRTVPSEP